uniref:Ribosomal protein L23/L25 N-terminal domain-containing protein n=1 Tax=Ditylenchus dipsaci TaxID=166011 RepID=A0A915ED94_9BILA
MAPSTKAPKKQVSVKKGKQAVAKAVDAKKRVVKGNKGLVQKKKVRTSVHFYRPATLKLPRSPKCPHKAVPKRDKLDRFAIIKHPLTTESAMKKIEDTNTLVFIVDMRANKHQIKGAVMKLYNIKVQQVNTLISPMHLKKAYVRLSPEFDALDVANKIGII